MQELTPGLSQIVEIVDAGGDESNLTTAVHLPQPSPGMVAPRKEDGLKQVPTSPAPVQLFRAMRDGNQLSIEQTAENVTDPPPLSLSTSSRF
jgi:hypothetical protein